MKSNIDFINGKTHSCLMKMFMPLFFAMTLTMIYSMVDSLWVGNLLGEHGLSALTAGVAIVLIMNSLSMGVGSGVSVMIAHMVGADDKKDIPGATATILVASGVVSLLCCVVTEILVLPILKILGTPTEILKDASVYLMLYLIGNVALFIYMQFTSIFRAFGDPVFQMKGMLMTVIFDAVADPFMIQWWGIAGAAIATVISEVLCLVYALVYYKKKKLFTCDFKSMDFSYVRIMIKLCVPTTIQAIMPAVSSAIMISFITSYGVTVVAGYGVARNLELIMFMPTTAMCMAITAIVGQCKGAQRLDRAKAYVKSSLFIGGLYIACISTGVVVFSGVLTGLFGQKAQVSAVVTGFFRVISIGYVLYMLTSCLQGFITGIGKAEIAMLLLVLYYIVIRIPTAFILKGMVGLSGIWMAFLISHIVALLIAIVLYKRSIRKLC